MDTDIISLKPDEGENYIIGQAHFIKTVEDLYEALAEARVKFGIAFCEASGPRKIRKDGNDENLIKKAVMAASEIAAGHIFVIVIKDGFPINAIEKIRRVPEVVRLFAATGNPLQVLVVETEQGRGVIGVVDGYPPLGIETAEEEQARKEFLRKIGYKR